MSIDSGIIGRINNELNNLNNENNEKLRGRHKIKKDVIYIIRKELEAIARYGQFRLRGVNYFIEVDEDENKIKLSITVPINQFPLFDISNSIEKNKKGKR